MDLLELLKTIGAAAGNIVTISGCLALCIRPIREKLARFIQRASRTDTSEKTPEHPSETSSWEGSPREFSGNGP